MVVTNAGVTNQAFLNHADHVNVPDTAFNEVLEVGTPGTARVPLTTLGHYFAPLGVQYIDVLATDTNGLDFLVGEGAAEWLFTGRVGLYLLELYAMGRHEKHMSGSVERILRVAEDYRRGLRKSRRRVQTTPPRKESSKREDRADDARASDGSASGSSTTTPAPTSPPVKMDVFTYVQLLEELGGMLCYFPIGYPAFKEMRGRVLSSPRLIRATIKDGCWKPYYSDIVGGAGYNLWCVNRDEKALLSVFERLETQMDEIRTPCFER